MKMMTKKLAKKIPPLRATEFEENPMVVAHYFNPTGIGDWYVLEGEQRDDGDWLFFGLVNLFEKEYGYFTLKEIEGVKLPFGMKIERDLYWTPVNVSEV